MQDPELHPPTSPITTTTTAASTTTPTQKQTSPPPNPPLQKSLRRISLHPSLTPYRRRVYRVLLSVPRGRWTTYSALAAYLGSSARAVGNAMRTNPFAPDVPCHRVLARDGSLGGYKGEWERRNGNGRKKGTTTSGKVVIAGGGDGDGPEMRCKGRSREEKIRLLMDEGVVFDSEERATGGCFGEFVELA